MQGFGLVGGTDIKHYQKQCYTFQIDVSENRVYRKSIDINLETRRNCSKSGHYSPTSGDREIRFKIWILPDYTGELTALLSQPG